MKILHSKLLVVTLIMAACYLSFHAGRISSRRIATIEPHESSAIVNSEEAPPTKEMWRKRLADVQNDSRNRNQPGVEGEPLPEVSTNNNDKSKKLQAELIRAQVKAITDAEMANNYSALDAIGLTPEQIRQVHANSLLIHEKASKANTAIEELSRQRAVHDLEMKRDLSPEKYKNYVAFETSRPYRVELEEAIEPLLASKGLTLGLLQARFSYIV